MATAWEFKDLSLVKSAALAAALRYWRSKAGGSSIPSRSQIDPLEMRQFLSKVLMIDVESEHEFTYRLCGTHVAGINGKDLTGQRASDVNLGASSTQFIETYQRAIHGREPILFTGVYGGRTGSGLALSRSFCRCRPTALRSTNSCASSTAICPRSPETRPGPGRCTKSLCNKRFAN
jgi:hypothetical protein